MNLDRVNLDEIEGRVAAIRRARMPAEMRTACALRFVRGDAPALIAEIRRLRAERRHDGEVTT